MTAEKPGAVFDCMVFVQALARENGPAAACQREVDRGNLILFLSPEVLAGVREVLGRPKLRRLLRRLTPEQAAAFLEDLSRRAVHVADVPRRFMSARDPKDERYVNLALAANARYLVSRDKDLLDLMNEATPEGQAFRQQYPDLKILDPAALLRELAAMQQPAAAPDDPGGQVVQAPETETEPK